MRTRVLRLPLSSIHLEDLWALPLRGGLVLAPCGVMALASLVCPAIDLTNCWTGLLALHTAAAKERLPLFMVRPSALGRPHWDTPPVVVFCVCVRRWLIASRPRVALAPRRPRPGARRRQLFPLARARGRSAPARDGRRNFVPAPPAARCCHRVVCAPRPPSHVGITKEIRRSLFDPPPDHPRVATTGPPPPGFTKRLPPPTWFATWSRALAFAISSIAPISAYWSKVLGPTFHHLSSHGARPVAEFFVLLATLALGYNVGRGSVASTIATTAPWAVARTRPRGVWSLAIQCAAHR